MDELRQHLKNEWKRDNHNKYQKYFDEWFKNLTSNQVSYFRMRMKRI